MNMKFDRNVVQQTYDFMLNDIKKLMNKKEQAISQGGMGYMMAELIDAQIKQKQEELEHIKYALNNMT